MPVYLLPYWIYFVCFDIDLEIDHRKVEEFIRFATALPRVSTVGVVSEGNEEDYFPV